MTEDTNITPAQLMLLARIPHTKATLRIPNAMAEPCGSCRQVLHEFSTPDTVIYLDNGLGTKLLEFKLSDLIPFINQ